MCSKGLPGSLCAKSSYEASNGNVTRSIMALNRSALSLKCQ
jgi:hypothetical protein